MDSIPEKMLKETLAPLLVIALMTTASYGQTYSNSFEYEDWDAALVDGWSYAGPNEPTISFVTSLQDTGATPTEGSKALEIDQPISGGIQRTIFEEDVDRYVISFDWYVVNPESSVSGGTGSKGYDSYFQLGSADGSTGIQFRAHHFSESREIEPGVIQQNARALKLHRVQNGTVSGISDHTSYAAVGNNAAVEARFFQDGWNRLEIWATEHPDVGGDWLRYFLNGNYVGESNVNWFNWNPALSTIEFGWRSLANPGDTNTNVAYFDNFSVELPAAGLAGDFDNDNDVDGEDFLAWQRGLSPNPLSAADLSDWEANYGTVAGLSAGNVTAVPEPSSCLLLSITLLLWKHRHARNLSARN